MTIQIEINGLWQPVTKQQVFDMAIRGEIQPQTIIDVDGQKIVTVYFPILFFFWRFRYSREFFACKVLFSGLCFGVTFFFSFFVFEYFFNWNYCFRAILSESGVRCLIGTTPQHILRSTPVKNPSIAVSKFPILK
jgi:hypothetical protein